MEVVLRALAALLSGYFHQDWDLEASDPLELARRSIVAEPPELLTQVISDIDVLMHLATDDRSLARELLNMGCYYDPRASGLGVAEWLAQLSRVLTAEVSRRAD